MLYTDLKGWNYKATKEKENYIIYLLKAEKK